MSGTCVVNKIILATLFLSLLGVIQLSNGWMWLNSDNVFSRIKYRCGSGEIIDLLFLCDGKVDCKDGSDETENRCSIFACDSHLFQCKYGACIPKYEVCNGKKNCVDNSDEENCNKTIEASTCNAFEFRCNDGQCIKNTSVCDGVKTCADGSDEITEICASRIFEDSLYRCTYGAYVHKTAQCNGVIDCVDGSDEANCSSSIPTIPTTPVSITTIPTTAVSAVTSSITSRNGCLLPAHLPHGKYQLNTGKRYTYTHINLTCDPGYIPAKIRYFFCMNNKWNPRLDQGYCIRTCPSLPLTDTYSAICKRRHKTVSCKTPLEGTRAKLICKPNYTNYGPRQISTCRDGNWDPYPVSCDPVCGKQTVNTRTDTNEDALKQIFPWRVAIYKFSSNQNNSICGGSIISRLYVLSAAHCFTDAIGIPYDINSFTIVAGKYYRSLDITESGVQVRKIKRLLVHEDYKGRLQKFRDNIALIEVDAFELTPKVQMVCIDWENSYEEQDFQENNKAFVAGWRFTKKGSTSVEVSEKLMLPFISTETCSRYMSQDFFRQYYATDKICAGYKDRGISACKADTGGGLYFRSRRNSFYIRGIISLAVRTITGCDSNEYTLFTKVSKFLGWIAGITRRRL